jgi:uncharacterized protein YjdB
VGTPAYMSPEQCSGLAATGASDQYALGVVAYKMLAGEAPFDADSTVALMYKHLHVVPDPIHKRVPDCPPGLGQVVMRMLEKSPADRWPQMEDMVAALDAVPQSESGEVRTQMLQLARSSSARAIVERFRTPKSPVPRSRPGVSVPPEAGITLRTPSGEGVAVAPAGQERSGSRRPGPAARRRLLWVTVPVGAIALVLLFLGRWYPSGVADAEPVTPSALEAGPPAPPAAAVAAVELVPSAPALSVGDVAELTLVARDGDGNPVEAGEVVWSSRDPGVALVSSAGVVTAMGPGTAEITAAAAGRTAVARLTVTEGAVEPEPPPARAEVASVTVTPTSGALLVGETLRFQVTLRDARGSTLPNRAVTWASSDPGVVRVSGDGVVSAVGPGAASVTATSEGRTQGAVVTVTAPRTVAAIEVTPGRRALEPGESVRLSAAVRDRTGALLPDGRVTWRSGDERVVRVSEQGMVTAVGEGSALVTAVSGTVIGSAEIVVAAASPPVTVDHRAAIESVVAAYARAIQAQDLTAARQLYPTMTDEVVQRWSGFFAAVRDLRVSMAVQDVDVEGDVARARVEMTLEFRDTRQQREMTQVPMTLRQDGGVWRIVEIR